jgi:hypothetical protein
MRKIFILATALFATYSITTFISGANAQQPNRAPMPVQAAPGMPMQGYAGDDCDNCDPCGNRRCGHCGHRNYIEGKDLSFNCGCQGSYKFPVPPQYTYHWPGMYSQRLMTDYHSPWRFPPLKPYTDEVKTHQAKPTPVASKMGRSELR